MTATPELHTETDIDTSPETLRLDLAQLHVRAISSPTPRHPAALGWQMTAASMSALASRLLDIVQHSAPQDAENIAAWFAGPFGDGPDLEEHADWLLYTVAPNREAFEKWLTEGRQAATEAKACTETFETIRYTADVVAVTPSGDVLLIERDWPPHEGAWALPGGHVDPGETSRAAAARELAEETGVQVEAAALCQIGVFDEPNRDPRGRYVTVAYLAQVSTNTPIAAGDDARTARWWPLKSLPDQLAFDHADILRAVAPTS